jgi:hypothetical protein
MRRLLFLGLTLALGSVLVSLVVQSRRRQGQRTAPAAAVRTAQPTPTRVVRPEDLEIVESSTGFGPGGSMGVVVARHRLVIRNNGRVAYRDLVLELAYVGRSGESVDARRRTVEGPLAPGGVLTLDDLVESGVPARARAARFTIATADIEPAARPNRPGAR